MWRHHVAIRYCGTGRSGSTSGTCSAVPTGTAARSARRPWPTCRTCPRKRSTLGWWDDVTLGCDLGVAGPSTDEVYAAMDWLAARQHEIEAALAGRHLRQGGMAL